MSSLKRTPPREAMAIGNAAQGKRDTPATVAPVSEYREALTNAGIPAVPTFGPQQSDPNARLAAVTGRRVHDDAQPSAGRKLGDDRPMLGRVATMHCGERVGDHVV